MKELLRFLEVNNRSSLKQSNRNKYSFSTVKTYKERVRSGHFLKIKLCLIF